MAVSTKDILASLSRGVHSGAGSDLPALGLTSRGGNPGRRKLTEDRKAVELMERKGPDEWTNVARALRALGPWFEGSGAVPGLSGVSEARGRLRPLVRDEGPAREARGAGAQNKGDSDNAASAIAHEARRARPGDRERGGPYLLRDVLGEIALLPANTNDAEPKR